MQMCLPSRRRSAMIAKACWQGGRGLCQARNAASDTTRLLAEVILRINGCAPLCRARCVWPVIPLPVAAPGGGPIDVLDTPTFASFSVLFEFREQTLIYVKRTEATFAL